MIDRSRLSSLIALSLIVAISGLGGLACGGANNVPKPNTNSGAAATPDSCASVTDKMIVDSIYGQIALDGELGSQIKQININAKSQVVTLFGWVATEAQQQKVIDLAKNTACVTSVTSKDFYGSSNNPTRPGIGGCVAPYIRCGDICIPSTEHCSLGVDPVPVANTSTKK